jgi:hypothetical protein
MWRFSTSPITYHPGWRPTPRWAARVLGIYAIAALCGGLLFVIYTLAFISPRETRPNPTTPPETGTPAAPPDTVIEEALPLVARARDSLKLISIACSSTDQPVPIREVTYRSSEADELAKHLIEGMQALPPSTNLPCIRNSVANVISLAAKSSTYQVININFFAGQRTEQRFPTDSADNASASFYYCVSAPPNEQFVPDTARLVIDKGDLNSARIVEANPTKICGAGKTTASVPFIATHIEVIKVAKSKVPIPDNDLSCDGFVRNPDGSWIAGNTKPFSIGNNVRHIRVANSRITYRTFNFGGVDLAVLLDQKCGGYDQNK